MEDRKELESPNYLEKYYTVESAADVDRALFHASHYITNREYKSHKDWQKWNCITGHLYLGKIPTQNVTAELLDKSNIPNLKLVVSCVKPFELNGNLGSRVVTKPSDWNKNNVSHHQIMIADYSANVEVEDLYATVKKMRQHISKGEDVYVHCKAGKGRSAMVVATYLAVYETRPGGICENMTPPEIFKLMKEKMRAQVGLRAPQFEKIEAVMSYHKLHKDDQPDFNFAEAASKKENVKMADIHQYLTSFSGKQALAQLSATKAFLIYSDEKHSKFKPFNNRQNSIQTFLTEMYKAKGEANWLALLYNADKGPIADLLNARPFKGFFGITGVPKERAKLVEMMKNDVTEMLAKVFDCNKEHIQKILLEQAPEMQNSVNPRTT